MHIQNKPQLIAYPNRIGSTLSDLSYVLEHHLLESIGGIHILPMYPSNADDGFSPRTHLEVDPQFGSFDDIEYISKTLELDICVDLVLNHLSDDSDEYQDFIAKRDKSIYWSLFYVIERDFGTISHDIKSKIHIRREKDPFMPVTFGDGSTGHVWSTFTDKQIDLNYNSPLAWELMASYIKGLTQKGVNLFRLDAFGYVTKKPGTSCFLVEPDVFDSLHWFRDTASEYGADILPEVHDDFSYQIQISRGGMFAYGFALPPLVLHAFYSKNTSYLKKYLRQAPMNQITVLDTHDGICIPDVRGLLPDGEIKKLVKDVNTESSETIYRRKSGDSTHSVGGIYQLTTTFYDAMHRNDMAYIAARAIQLFTPGIPQIYYIGLIGGFNDFELAEQSGDPRSVNRHIYTKEEYIHELQSPLSQKIQHLMKIRNTHPAFNGEFSLVSTSDHEISIMWRNGDDSITLFVNVETHYCGISGTGLDAFCNKYDTIVSHAISA